MKVISLDLVYYSNMLGGSIHFSIFNIDLKYNSFVKDGKETKLDPD